MTHRLPALLISAAVLAMPVLMLGGCATHDSRITTLAAPMQLTDLGLDIEIMIQGPPEEGARERYRKRLDERGLPFLAVLRR